MTTNDSPADATSKDAIECPETDDIAKIDFHAGPFNCVDDLNDYSGNYRSFDSLDGIVTADMRHQMERRLIQTEAHPFAGDATPLKKLKQKSVPAESAEAVEFLTVISTGRTLIIDNDSERAITCGKLLSDGGLICTLLVLNSGALPETPAAVLDRLTFLKGNGLSITGAFGGFVATVTVDGREPGPAKEAPDQGAIFDLILDLQTVPAFEGGYLPMGYYTPGQDSAALARAIAELPEMRGRFKKPQFISLREEQCLHGRSRKHDCTLCLEICPVGAIRTAQRKISVNHYLCQGCGGCTLVCPADAIRRVQPAPEELSDRLKGRLENRPAADIPSILVITDSAAPDSDILPDVDERDRSRVLRFEMEQIGHVGLELILTAFGHGAHQVIVACGPQNSTSIREAVAGQVRMADAILQGVGLGENKISFVLAPHGNRDSESAACHDSCPVAEPDDSPTPDGPRLAQRDKRTLVRQALRHLQTLTNIPPWLPLPAGSPYGTVSVDSATCTLCMACAVACPSGALFAGGDTPRLQFLEARCHQCGLCREICPEGAIRLLPGIHCDPDTAEAKVILGEAEPFRCIECGKPFASQAMINRMQNKLTGHWMYAGERQLRRLQMCGACRAGDSLASEDVKLWNRS